MTTNWSQDNYDSSNEVEREAERSLRVHSKSPAPRTILQIDHPLTNRVEAESLLPAGYNRSKMWFVYWDVVLAALAGAVIFFFLNFVSLGVLGSALTVAAIVTAVGLGHYLLWGRVFARRGARESQRLKDEARRSETSETEAPDTFLLELDDRERMELLQILEQSLGTVTQGHEGRGDRAAIRRGLQDRVRMFGA